MFHVLTTFALMSVPLDEKKGYLVMGWIYDNFGWKQHATYVGAVTGVTFVVVFVMYYLFAWPTTWLRKRYIAVLYAKVDKERKKEE